MYLCTKLLLSIVIDLPACHKGVGVVYPMMMLYICIELLSRSAFVSVHHSITLMCVIHEDKMVHIDFRDSTSMR